MTTSLESLTRMAVAHVDRKVDDARAHAGRAVTDALRATPDGRATLRRAARSPSSRAALARLDELLDDLCGPSSRSLDGFLREAREVFYRAAWERWHARIPAEVLRPGLGDSPPATAVLAARGIVLHGYDLRQELAGPIRGASRRLSAAIALAGRSHTTDRTADDLLDAWARKAKADIARVAALALGDSLVALDRQAGRDQVRPELLDDSPIAEGE